MIKDKLKDNILTILLLILMVSAALTKSYSLEIQAAIDPIILETNPPKTSLPITPPIDRWPLAPFGDLNSDGMIDIQDYIILSNNFGKINAKGDLDNSNIVDIQDYTIFSNNFGRTS